MFPFSTPRKYQKSFGWFLVVFKEYKNRRLALNRIVQANFKLYSYNWMQHLTLSLPVPRWADGNTDLPSNSNKKTIRVNIAFTSIQ